MMQEQRFTVRFDSPAFLGNAEQSGQWRTPPFKALLRQWWRVAAARSAGYDVARLRAAEAELLGSASDEGGGSRQSRLRLRLGSWKSGTLTGAWGNDPPVFHNEVGTGGRNVGSHLYLGYGPLTFSQGTKLKTGAAIQEGEQAELRLAWPADGNELQHAVQLAHWFGTLGGRSRNGWGSLAFDPEGGAAAFLSEISHDDPLLGDISRPLEDCLRHDWPHALGVDDGQHLVWRSKEAFPDWRTAMQHLAKVKIAFRTQDAFAFDAGHGPFADRHVLAYPVTNHSVGVWGNQKRLANQLRFKVRKRPDGKYEALAFHFPCATPREMAASLGHQAPDIARQAAIWRKVHAVLDHEMQRL